MNIRRIYEWMFIKLYRRFFNFMSKLKFNKKDIFYIYNNNNKMTYVVEKIIK